MYCELKSRFRHSRFTFLHELRTYRCSFGLTNRYIYCHLVLAYIYILFINYRRCWLTTECAISWSSFASAADTPVGPLIPTELNPNKVSKNTHALRYAPWAFGCALSVVNTPIGFGCFERYADHAAPTGTKIPLDDFAKPA